MIVRFRKGGTSVCMYGSIFYVLVFVAFVWLWWRPGWEGVDVEQTNSVWDRYVDGRVETRLLYFFR